MGKNKFLKVLCLGVFIVHAVIVNTGAFSSAMNQMAVSAGTGSMSCDVSFTAKYGYFLDEIERKAICIECKWITWEEGTNGEYIAIHNSDEILFDKMICKEGAKQDRCMSTEFARGLCPPDEPEPPGTGTGTN